MEEPSGNPPTRVNPYKVLRVKKDASDEEIKKSYKQLALRHHPDKVVADQKPAAHARFQEIAFAYAVLSSPKRRSRYDITGSTSDSIHLDDDDDFNWLDFFRSQYKEHVTSSHINSFRARYQGSEEEKRDVLVAYTAHKGSMLKVFNAIMLSNPLEDEARFRGYIDEAIKEGRVEEHKAYTKETAKSKNKRLKAAGREARLAEEHAKLLGLKVDDVKEVGRKGAPVPAQEDLAALIQQRQKGRAEGFLEGLEAKYAKKEVEKKAKGKGKKRKVEEEGMPDEEAFQAAAKRLKKRKEGEDRDELGKATNEKRKGAKKASTKTPDDDDDDDDDDDKHGESDGESLGADSLEEEDVDVEEQEEASAGSDEDSSAASEEEEDAMDTTPVTASSPARPTTSTRQSKIRPSSSTANTYAPFNNKNFSSNHPSFKPPKKKPVVNREKARAAKEAKNAEKERMKRTLRGLGALEETAKEKRRKKALGRMGR